MNIRERIIAVQDKLSEAASRSGRESSSITLVAVSKFHDSDAVREAIAAGLHLFGENRVQEALTKFPALLSDGLDATVHLIGSLQRNKVKQAVSLFKCVQSVDRLELLTEIERQAAAAALRVEILFEYHTGEETKAGYQDRDSLFRSLDALEAMPHLRCRGLMTMAPFTKEDAPVRNSFKTLRALSEDCARRYPQLDFSVLSMGMSNDFDIAIQEGSTMVRIGTAIFGERQ